MGLFSTADTFYAFRFLRLLTTAWEDTGAFKAGLIDKDGKQVRKAETSDERSVYNIFHRLVFNVKRTLNKVPFGKTTIASYLTALYLIKENTDLTEDEIKAIISEVTDAEFPTLTESKTKAMAGCVFVLKNSVPHPKTGEIIAHEGTEIDFKDTAWPVGYIFGQPMFEGYHLKSKKWIIVGSHDVE